MLNIVMTNKSKPLTGKNRVANAIKLKKRWEKAGYIVSVGPDTNETIIVSRKAPKEKNKK